MREQITSIKTKTYLVVDEQSGKMFSEKFLGANLMVGGLVHGGGATLLLCSESGRRGGLVVRAALDRSQGYRVEIIRLLVPPSVGVSVIGSGAIFPAPPKSSGETKCDYHFTFTYQLIRGDLSSPQTSLQMDKFCCAPRGKNIKCDTLEN